MRLFPAALSDVVRTDGAAAMNAAPPANFNRVRRVVFMAKLLPSTGVSGYFPKSGARRTIDRTHAGRHYFGKRETFAERPAYRAEDFANRSPDRIAREG